MAWSMSPLTVEMAVEIAAYAAETALSAPGVPGSPALACADWSA